MPCYQAMIIKHISQHPYTTTSIVTKIKGESHTIWLDIPRIILFEVKTDL